MTLADQAVGLPPDVVRCRLHATLEDAARALHRLADLLGLPPVERHRLLAVDVLARLEGGHADLRVPMVGRGDQHRIDLGPRQDILVVVIHGGLGDRRSTLFAGLVDIADPDDLHLLVRVLAHLHQAPQVPRPLAAATDDGHVDAVVGAKDGAGGRRTQRCRADGSSSGRRRGNEAPAAHTIGSGHDMQPPRRSPGHTQLGTLGYSTESSAGPSPRGELPGDGRCARRLSSPGPVDAPGLPRGPCPQGRARGHGDSAAVPRRGRLRPRASHRIGGGPPRAARGLCAGA